MAKTTSPAPQKAANSPRFISSMTFSKMDYSTSWFVEDILMEGQPAVIGGPKKSLKTTLALDLAISVGTQTPFLGTFNVPNRHRVVVMSGESGEAALQETARRIWKSKGACLEQDCEVMWSFSLPRFQDSTYCSELTTMLRDKQVKAVIIDPLYLCLLDGATGASASNLYEIGPLLLRASNVCLDAGATPIFVHHATKGGTKRTAGTAEPLDLDDLAFSGIGEFARQWLLVSRETPYQPGSGRHNLVLNAGGSAGHSGAWRLRIDEGTFTKDLKARKWKVKVQGHCPGEATPMKTRPRTGKPPYDEEAEIAKMNAKNRYLSQPNQIANPR